MVVVGRGGGEVDTQNTVLAANVDSLWAKSEKVTVWSHEREQRFDTSNLFFNLLKNSSGLVVLSRRA